MIDKEDKKLAATWLSGEAVPGIRFKYNSLVKVRLDDGEKAQGWIVGVDPSRSEPIYTVEIQNGHPCAEIPESAIENVNEDKT